MNSTNANIHSFFKPKDTFNEAISTYVSNLLVIISSFTEKAYSSFITQVIESTNKFTSEKSLIANKTQNNSSSDSTKDEHNDIHSAYINLLLLIQSYDDLLITESNNSLPHSYKLFVFLCQSKTVFTTEEIQTLLYKIIQLSMIRSELFISNRKVIDNLITLWPNNLLLQNKYKKLLNKVNESVSLLKDNKTNQSNDLIPKSAIDKCDLNSIIPFCISRFDIKVSVDDPIKLSSLFSQLEHESSIIDQYTTKQIESSLSLISSFTDLNLKYMYIFKKIIDEFDKQGTLLSNPSMKQIFFSIIFNSHSFTAFLLNNIKISYEYLSYNNKEVYMTRYITIGNFLYKRINFNKEYYQEMQKKVNNIINGLIKPLEQFFGNEGFDAKSTNVISSIYHSLLFSFMFRADDKNIFNTLALSVDIHDSDTMSKLFRYIKPERRIKSAYFNDISFIMVDYDIIHGHSCKILIENNKDVLLIQSLSTYFFSNPQIIFLYVSIKSWSIKRGLFFDNTFVDNNNSNRIFDDCVLLYLVGLFLIHCGYCEPYDNSNESINFSIGNILLPKINNSSLEQIGELFVNFFYFIISLANKVNKENKNGVLIVDIQSKQITLSKRDTYPRFNNYYHKNQSIEENVLIMKKFHNKIKGRYFFAWKLDQFNNLEKEAYRMLHYLLIEDGIKTVFGFIEKRK